MKTIVAVKKFLELVAISGKLVLGEGEIQFDAPEDEFRIFFDQFPKSKDVQLWVDNCIPNRDIYVGVDLLVLSSESIVQYHKETDIGNVASRLELFIFATGSDGIPYVIDTNKLTVHKLNRFFPERENWIEYTEESWESIEDFIDSVERYH